MSTILSLFLLSACTPDTEEVDTDTDESVVTAVLVGDDVPSEEILWAYGVFHLELTLEALTGTVTYSEEWDSGDAVCEGTLALSGAPETDQVCSGDPCTWGYLFTAEGADITSGDCAYPVPDMAFNLSDPATSGLLACWEDTYARSQRLTATARWMERPLLLPGAAQGAPMLPLASSIQRILSARLPSASA